MDSTTSVKTQSKMGIAAYEQVLSRNFQIIETFLSKFHEIFKKQSQFEEMAAAIQNRLLEAQINNMKIPMLEEKVVSSIRQFEKKITSLKDFVIEQISVCSKSESLQEQYLRKGAMLASNQLKSLIENQNVKNKQIQSCFTDKIINLQAIQCELTNRISSLRHQVNKIDSSAHKEDLISFMDSKICQFNVKIEAQIEKIQKMKVQYSHQTFEKVRKQAIFTNEQVSNLKKRLVEMQEKMPLKVDMENFKQIQQNLSSMMKNYEEDAFGLKSIQKQIKKALLFFQRKLQKFDLIEQLLKRENEGQEIAVNSVSVSLKKRPFSIHSFKKYSKYENTSKQQLLTKKFGEKRKFKSNNVSGNKPKRLSDRENLKGSHDGSIR